MRKVKDLESFVMDFPREHIETTLIKYDDGDALYTSDHTVNGTNISYRRRKTGMPHAKIEYDRRKAILNHCFNVYIEAQVKDYMTFPYKKKE